MTGLERCSSVWRAGVVLALAFVLGCQALAPSPPPAPAAPAASAAASLDDDPRRALRELDARLARNPGDAAAQRERLARLFELELSDQPLEAARRQEARASLDELLAASPDQPALLTIQAQRLLADRRPEEALASVRRSLELAPGDLAAQRVEADALERLGDIAGARRTLEQALAAAPDAHRLRLDLAEILILSGDYTQALAEARRVEAARPADEAPRMLAADALLRSGRPDAALTELSAIPAARRSGELLYRIGQVQVAQGDRLGARRMLSDANLRQPNDPDILEALFELDAGAGTLVAYQALQRIARASASRPDDARLAELQGRASASIGRVGEAFESFDRALELDPQNERVYATASAILAAMKEEQALKIIEDSRKTRPKSGAPDLVLGGLYETKGDRKRALAAYDKALALEPGLAVAKNGLAYLLLESDGDVKRAQTLAREARRELPHSPLVSDTLGYAALKSGDAAAALPYFFEALGRFPPNDSDTLLVQVHLAEAQRALGETAKARVRLQHVVDRVGASQLPPGVAEPEWIARARAMLAELKTP